MKIYKGKEAIQGVAVDVIDNLTTNSATDALSAKQGFVLKSVLDAQNARVLVLEEDSGWIALPLQNGWLNRAANDRPLRIRKIGKVVYLEGNITGGIWHASVVATVPVGMRPRGNHSQTIIRAGAGMAICHVNANTTSSGNITIENRGGDNTEVAINATWIAES